MQRQASETEYDFTLALLGIGELSTRAEDALFQAGCNDATLSIRCGRVFATFSRTASSLKQAILSAIRDVRAAGIGADVLRVDTCNLVSQADVARKIGRSRQLVHQYIAGSRGPGGFPPPACEMADGAPLWYWFEVAYWLWENDMIKETVLHEARELAMINSALELKYQRQLQPELAAEVMDCVSTVYPAEQSH